jgi:hypothetical protein
LDIGTYTHIYNALHLLVLASCMGPQLYFVNKFILAPNHISWVTVNGIKAREMHMVLEWKVLKLIDLIYIIVFIFTVDFVQFLVVLLKIESS